MYLVVHDSLYYAGDRPRRDIVELKAGLAFVIRSIRRSVCRACSVEKDIKPFLIVHRENGFHEMCQWVVTIESKGFIKFEVESDTHVKSLDT